MGGSGKAKRAAILTRESKDHKIGTEDARLAVDRQEEDCRALVAQRGWTLVLLIEENDQTASGRKARPKFRQLLDVINRGEIDVVVAWTLDRICRNARDRLALVDACRDHDVSIALVRGSDLDLSTPAGRLSIGLLGEVAAAEVDQSSDRRKRAARQSAEAGKPHSGSRPFGYLAGGRELHPAEASAVRQAYTDVAAGTPLRAVATRWNSEGFRTGKGGNRFTPSAVRRILLNERNVGVRVHTPVKANGTPDLAKREEHPACWPALVEREVFEDVARILRDPARRTNVDTRGRPAVRLLSGIAVCAAVGEDGRECGLPVNGAGRWDSRAATYRCSSARAPRERPPGSAARHVGRQGDVIDEFVTGLIIARLSRPDARELLHDARRPDVAALRAEAARLRRSLDALAEDRGATLGTPDEIPLSEYRAMRARPAARLIEIDAALRDNGRAAVLGDLPGAPDVAERWQALSIDRQRAIVDLLLEIRLPPLGRGYRGPRAADGSAVIDPATVITRWRI